MSDLEIFEYEGEGYQRTMHFENWRVAIANHTQKFDRLGCTHLERHLLTDEVFVLLKGDAVLVTGLECTETKMEIGKVYNVKQGAWHAIYMEKDAKVLIVENHDTCRDNSERYPLHNDTERKDV